MSSFQRIDSNTELTERIVAENEFFRHIGRKLIKKSPSKQVLTQLSVVITLAFSDRGKFVVSTEFTISPTVLKQSFSHIFFDSSIMEKLFIFNQKHWGAALNLFTIFLL